VKANPPAKLADRWRAIEQRESNFKERAAQMPDPAYDNEFTAEQAHNALIERLARLDRKPFRVRPPRSLQPTPEAAKSRVRRLLNKRLLLQRSLGSELPSSPVS
jgi:hypothetical protein